MTKRELPEKKKNWGKNAVLKTKERKYIEKGKSEW